MPLGHSLCLTPHLSQVSDNLRRAPFLPAANRLSPQSREDGCLGLSFKFFQDQEPKVGLLLFQLQLGKPQGLAWFGS